MERNKEGARTFLPMSVLKLIAIMAMLIDHLAWGYLDDHTAGAQVMHVIGRLTLPIMCFGIAEGFRRTSNISKYCLRLLIFGVISSAPFYMFFGKMYGGRVNIILDLLMALLVLIIQNDPNTGKRTRIIGTALLITASALIGGWPVLPILYVMIFYYFREDFRKIAIWFSSVTVAMVLGITAFWFLNNRFGWVVLDWSWEDKLYLLGFILPLFLIYRYNGKRDLSNFRMPSWLFYFFYPVHLLALTFACGVEYNVHSVFVILHLLAMLLVIILIVMTIMGGSTRVHMAFSLTLLSGLAFMGGYLVELLNPDVVSVFAVVKIEYIAECAFIITFSWFTAEFLHYKFPLWAYLLEGLVSCATIISVMWMEKTTLFYRSYSMDYSGIVPVAVVEPGVMYYVFYGLVVILCLIIVVVGLYKMRKVGFIDAKRIRSILWAIASLWAFIGARIIGLTKYDLISFGILSSMCIIAFAIVRYGFVNPAQIAADNAINHISEGIIVLDTSNQIIMLNKTSRALFPSLVEGGHISAIDGIEEILSDKRTTMEKDGNIYEFRKESLQENNIFCGYLLWAINITDQMKYLNVIKEQAETDSLTHLYNRIYFTNKVTEALRERAGGTLFMMDLDNFKGVNDHYGHGVGDGVLVTFAEHIRDCFRAREESIICRLGGDEFIVYIPEKLEESAVEEIVDNLIDNFSTKMIKAGLPTGTGCSVGICFAYKGSEFEDVYRNADKALYCAKARGKNTFMYFDAETMNDKRSEDN